MPFATLHYSTVDLPLEPEGAKGILSPGFTIHWGSDGVIQFGVELDRFTIVEMARLIAAGNYGNDRTFKLYSSAVSRREANESIKQIRRARDAIFGADA